MDLFFFQKGSWREKADGEELGKVYSFPRLPLLIVIIKIPNPSINSSPLICFPNDYLLDTLHAYVVGLQL